MDVQRNEKEWFLRLSCGNKSSKIEDYSTKLEKKEHSQSTSVKTAAKVKAKKTVRGFQRVAGMDALKALINEGFINVLNNRECAEAFGIVPPSILLYGPPGCGKTFFAETMAEEVGLDLIRVVPDDIASKWVHGTQEKIGEIFRKAEKEAPCILFLDELDAMVPQRTGDNRHNQNGEVNEFLCMLNNASKKHIYIVAASNHPEVIDKAVLRTGRIDEMIYVDMPDAKARESLFCLSLSKYPVAENIDYERLAGLTKGYNCTDIYYIVKVALRRSFNASIAEKDKPYKCVTQMLLESVISERSPSVTSKDLRLYERVRSEFSPKDRNAKKVHIGFQNN